MAMISVWLDISEKSVVPILQEAAEKLDGTAGEMVLDFVSVCRVNAAALRAIDAFASKAADKAVKIILRDVNVDVYKVLKLTKLAAKFSFVSRDGNRGRTQLESSHAKPSKK